MDTSFENLDFGYLTTGYGVSECLICLLSLLAWLRSQVVCLRASSSEALVTWMVLFLTPDRSGLTDPLQ